MEIILQGTNYMASVLIKTNIIFTLLYVFEPTFFAWFSITGGVRDVCEVGCHMKQNQSKPIKEQHWP